MSSHSDPHAELGVPRDATADEIHRAFRRRLRQHHPDTRAWRQDPASDRALQRVLDAYAILRREPLRPDDAAPSATATDAPDTDARSPGRPSAGQPLRATPVHWEPARTTPRDAVADARSDVRLTADRLIRWLFGGF
jgi:curved DNA-binding protein CbpA